jgi:hypothetical protein
LIEVSFMPFVVAAVVLVGALWLFDLLLTLAVVRRLREHTAQLGRLSGGGADGPPGFDRDALVGRRMPDFTATAAGGVAGSVLGFFSAGCEPCHGQAPELAAWAGAQAREPDGPATRAIAVVTGTGAEAAELVELLGDAVTVIAEPDSTRIVTELGVQFFPMFLRIHADGAVAEVSLSMREVRQGRMVAPSRG